MPKPNTYVQLLQAQKAIKQLQYDNHVIMRDQELVNALRCVSTAGGPMGDCKKCPFYKTEPVPEDLAGKVNLTEWSSCDVDAVGFAAADRIANMNTHILALQKEIENLRGQVHNWMPLPEREATEEAKEIHHEAWNRRADDERV